LSSPSVFSLVLFGLPVYLTLSVLHFIIHEFCGQPLQVTVRPMLSNHCLSCLCVTLVYCAQTVGWIKMPLGTEVGLGAGDIVLDGDTTPPRKWAQQPPLLWFTDAGKHASVNRGPCLLWPNGWVDQDATWYGGRPRPR